MKLPNARKFFGEMRKSIYGIFGRKIGVIAIRLKEQVHSQIKLYFSMKKFA
jgi:hypothetical protein